MTKLNEYFAQNRYKPRWFIGDRVQGKWNRIPFVGSVLNDGLVSEDQGARVSVYLDLPIAYKNKVYNIIMLNPKDLRERK